VFKIVPYDPSVPQMSDTSLLLYVGKRDSSFRVFTKVEEYHFEGELVKELRSQMAIYFGIAEESLLLAKLNRYNGTWQILEDVATAPSSAKEKTEKTDQQMTAKQEVNTTATTPSTENVETNKKAPQLVSVKNKPYALRDGGKFILDDDESDF
jgi:hypothetical protein